MTELKKVKKPDLERTGLNSLRDFFLDHWAGLILESDNEAEEYLKKFVNDNSEEKILTRLQKGKVFLFFVINGEIFRKLETQPDASLGYEFKSVAVDENLSLVYLQAKKNDPSTLNYVSAELNGHFKLLKRMGFDKQYIKPWMACRVADKITCIEEVKFILSDERLTEAFLQYSSFFNYNEYRAWVKHYEIDFQIRKGFRRLISDIIKQIKKK